MSLSGKIAIVTGGSRGIGAGIALELARRGADVAITFTSASSEAALDELIARIKSMDHHPRAAKVRADLRQVDAPTKILEETLSAFSMDKSGGQIDILVNNAGCEFVKDIVDITPEDFSYVYDLNVRGTLLMTKAVIPYLRKPGRIINIGSVGGRSGFAELSLYCSSKAALEGLTRCSAAELGPAGHTANAVSPGPIETAMIDKIPKAIVDMQRSQTPVEHRLGRVDDVAQIVAFLAEEGSRWVSGQVIQASGGMTMI